MPAMIKRIERVGGTRFQVYAKQGGRKKYVGTYESKRAAQDAEADYLHTQRRIRDGQLPPETDQRRSLQDAIDRWLTDLGRRVSRSEDAYRWFCDALILPVMGRRTLHEIQKRHVADWRDSFGGKYAPTTVNSALGCLSSAFEAFIVKGWVKENPCRGLERLPVNDRSYNWIRTVPEIERLLRECNDELRDMVAVAVGSGLRIDEVLHLQWDDVDLERRLLTVQRGRKGTPKGGMRHVPILDAVLPVLAARSLRRAGARLVFSSPRGSTRTKAPVTTSYKLALKAAGLDVTLRFHDLRHTFASMWVMNGGDIFRLSKVLGHKTVLVTQRTYAHLAPEVWQQDYERVTFRMPTEAKVIRLAGR